MNQSKRISIASEQSWFGKVLVLKYAKLLNWSNLQLWGPNSSICGERTKSVTIGHTVPAGAGAKIVPLWDPCLAQWFLLATPYNR